MMFNKYMVVAPEDANIRSRDDMFALLRRLRPERDLIWSDGILDVLDHATPTTGYGSKLAIDLTQVDLAEEPMFDIPQQLSPAGGVMAYDSSLVASLALLVLFADEEWRERVDVVDYLRSNGVEGVKYVALFDYNASEGLTHSDLLWLAAANTDPRRDIEIVDGVVVVDARSNRPGYGRNPRRFPNVVTSSVDTIKLVDARWSEYAIGEFVASPSLKYRKLLLSEGAEW
jgi:4-hydroxy-3-polyprenylbenzoate decarboxylase